MDLDIYSYCNYKDSAVGFQIGKVDLNSGKIEHNDSIPLYIIQAFQSDLVDKAYGRYPLIGNTKFFYLINNIDYLDHSPEPDKYINIAFECQDALALQKLKRFFQSKTPVQLSDIFGKMIFSDTSNFEYEMRFDVDQIKKLLQQLDNENAVLKKRKNYDYYLVYSSYENRTQELSDLFKLNECGYVLINEKIEPKAEQYIYRFVKKKNRLTILVLVIALLLFLLLFLWLRN